METGSIASGDTGFLRLRAMRASAQDGVNVLIEATDIDKLARFAAKEEIGLTVVGPEDIG